MSGQPPCSCFNWLTSAPIIFIYQDDAQLCAQGMASAAMQLISKHPCLKVEDLHTDSALEGGENGVILDMLNKLEVAQTPHPM
jgi:hypothetical protein